MRLAVFSDLHLEFAPFEPPPLDVDLVILAGDIDLGTKGIYWAERSFKAPVIYVVGNHEFYHGEVRDLWRDLRDAAAFCPKLTLLENQALEIEAHGRACRFLGTALWTDFAACGEDEVRRAMVEARDFMADYRVIRNGRRTLTPEDTLVWHEEAKNWLNAELGKPFEGETIVVTHHAPSLRSVAPRFEGSLLNGGFVSDLEDLVLATQPALWVHGHTHHNVDYRIGRTRVVANQRGYRSDRPASGFRPDLVLELD